MDLLTTVNVLEAVAVAFGVAYLLLAVRENSACWYAAFIGTGLSIGLFWNVSLPMESALNVFYLVMAFYGWWQWRQPAAVSAVAATPVASSATSSAVPVRATVPAGQRPIRRFRLWEHGAALVLIAALTMLSGTLLNDRLDAALPYLDSFTTWGSVVTTWMVAKKILENWLYWLVIDSASIVLYLDRSLYLYAGLFAAYLVIVVFGYVAWRKRLHTDASPSSTNQLVEAGE